MKPIFFGILFFVLGVANAQTWSNDLEEAKTQAQKENKEILLVFQGSDWCAPCIKLDREIWTSSEFKEYAKGHYVLVKADFPRRAKNQLPPEQQEKNNKLAEKFNQQGYFPLVVVMDEKGNVIGKTGYKKISPKEYIALLNSFKS
ncbi:MAG: thioredoxin family protein [Salinimicrobium sp.]